MIARQLPTRREDVRRILADVRPGASGADHATLTVLVGLPASGKSWVAKELQTRTGATILESDALRRLLFSRRSYSAAESRRLFTAIHGAIDELLAEGLSVVLDATNLAEAERAPLDAMADRHRATLLVVHVTAPDRVIRRRLARRARDGGSIAQADLRVYERMRTQMEEIQRQHHVVDTSQATESTLAAIAEAMTATRAAEGGPGAGVGANQDRRAS